MVQAFRQARRDFSLALRLDPKNVFAHVSLAFNLQADGQFQVAWDLLTAALAACAQPAPLYEARGVISLQV
jgi:Tfp pilus assembly protein PilF